MIRYPPFLFGLALLAGAATAQDAGVEEAPRFAGAFALPYLLCDCDPTDFVFRTTRPIPGYAEPDPAEPAIRTVEAGRLIEANDWNRALTVVDAPSVAVARHDVVFTRPEVYGDVRYLDL